MQRSQCNLRNLWIETFHILLWQWKQIILEKLSKLIEQIDWLQTKAVNSSEFDKWHSNVENLIEEIFEKETRYLEDFNSIYFTPLFLTCQMNDTVFEEAYLGGLEEARSFLSFLIEEIE